MNRHTALSLLAAAAFGLAMASASIASAVDNGRTLNTRTPECEAVVDAYAACLAGCESMPPSQLGSCQQACWTQDVDRCADGPSTQPLRATGAARTVRPQAALQRR